MPLSDDSSEISPSLAELTTQVVPAATTVSKTQSTPTAPTAVAASDGTDRPVFPVKYWDLPTVPLRRRLIVITTTTTTTTTFTQRDNTTMSRCVRQTPA